MKIPSNVTWRPEPEEHDFPAAEDFLQLVWPQDVVDELVHRLRAAATIDKKAKDVIRASRLPLLPKDNPHVARNLEKIAAGKELSPVLLVAGEPLIIADGYHRCCAVYYLSEDAGIRCRLVPRVARVG